MKWMAMVSAALLGFMTTAKAQEKTADVCSSPQLIGMNIENSKGESLGEVEDIVIDLKEGNTRYVAVAYGGTLGFGGKLFAVPAEALKKRKNKLILEVPQAKMESAKGFDANKWPTRADGQWASADAKPDKDGGKTVAKAANVYRVSSLTGLNVVNPKGQELGEVAGFAFGPDHKIRYLALSHGGVVGIGEKYFAIPMEAVTMKSPQLKAGRYAFVLNAPKSKFENAKGFKSDDWPAKATMKFGE